MLPRITTEDEFLCSVSLLLLHFVQMGGWIISVYLTFKIFFSSYSWILLPYLYWIFVRDADRYHQDARPWEYLIDSKFAHYVRNYYPVKIIKSEDYELDPKKNYYFNAVPHGILGIQSYIVFGKVFQATKETFPNHESQSCALSVFGRMPFYREIIYMLGAGSTSREAIINILKKPNGGHILGILPGGAEETFYSKPGTYKTIIKKRKGFVKIALTTGTPLVPVICFNIVDDFDYQIQNPFVIFVQKIVKKITSITFAFGHGRYGLPFFPKRIPTTFVGKLILIKSQFLY